MTVTLVAAVAANGVIGADGGMPWHLPEDLRRFRRLTTGRTLVMGRRTWDSIGRPLPGRRTVVVTRDRAWAADGATVAHSLADALALAGPDAVVVGGGEIYAAALPVADVLELTHVDRAVAGDTRFPEIRVDEWRETERQDRDGFSFVRYERRADTGAATPATLAAADVRPGGTDTAPAG
ncbi:dihydrofolate reductase [Nakamurella endophytica]|uniref:Dihydrofolate reductase n=1 Tax=Nakamurella endophytica TaxID=1748367 RepID=A0A917WCX6_9ACTN|nr:dihydrofolate reductase [Nakamurella endophytica]GGL92766.1 dihydrofolate reductase [Nakamurella endophytica]